MLHTGKSSMLTALRNGTESGLSTIICRTFSASCCHVMLRSDDVPRCRRDLDDDAFCFCDCITHTRYHTKVSHNT